MTWAIRPIGKLAECSEEWQLLNQATTNTPLLDFRFVRDAVSEFTTGTELVASYNDGGGPSAIGIFTRVNPFCWQTLQPPNAPIGLWICKPANNVEALLGYLAPSLSPHCAMLSVTQQDPEILPRPEPSRHLATLDYISTPSMTVSGPFSVYLQSRSKNFRHNVNRQRNRLERENIKTHLEFLTSSADMERAISEYSQLECASWKGRIDSAIKMDEPQGRFYVKLLRSFAELGESLVYRYFFNDRLVASDLCLRRNDTLIILKTACDETQQGLSPAHLMRLDAFAELFDKENIRRVEFYGPLKEWHTRLTDDRRQMYHINYYRWPVLKFFHEFRTDPHRGVSTETAGLKR